MGSSSIIAKTVHSIENSGYHGNQMIIWLPVAGKLGRCILWAPVTLTLSLLNKLSSAYFLVCFHFKSASMLLKVGENV